jgi:hypothetical protein
VRFFFFLAGIILLGFALFANDLGIDNDPGWGWGRALLLLAGLALALAALAVHLFRRGLLPERVRRAAARTGAAWRVWIIRAARCYPLAAALTLLLWAALAAHGAWLTSAGRFPAFPPQADFYARQADAFLHGQLALLEQPDPLLLALPDPYDMLARDASGARVLWDASLYDGKYYAYWGPVPAVLLAGVRLLGGQAHGSAVIAAGFYAGLAGVLAGLLHLLRRRYYPQAPGLSVPLFLLPAALNLHTLWLVGRPAVYETSILAGQFFLCLGLLLWVMYLERGASGWLALAGLSWGLAAGSRNTVVASVVLYAALALLWLWRAGGWSLRRLPWRKAAALVVPLGLSALALAVFNYARFGSPTETGVTYQLSLAVDVENHFSPAYVSTNLYMWLFYRFDLAETFPFFPFRITYNLHFPAWAVRPPFKMFDREFYGLLPSAPVTWLLALWLPLLVAKLRRGTGALVRTAGENARAAGAAPPPGRLALAAMIGLAGLAQFGLLLFFFYAATRYGADFILPGVLLAALAAWESDARLLRHARLRAGLWIAAAALALATAVIGAFGSFYVPEGFVRSLNRPLYDALAGQWNRVGAYLAGILRLAGRAAGR